MDNENMTGETGSEESFKELFEKSYTAPSRMRRGDRLDAEIVKITADWVLIDTGGKGEGYISRREFTDQEGNLAVAEGDRIRAYFTRSDGGEMHFTTRIGAGPAAMARLAEAKSEGLQIAAQVVKEIKGGFELSIDGTSAFCPFSHMALRRGEKKEEYIGRTMYFDIAECGGRRVVLSRKAIVESERRQREAELRESLHEGDRIRGVVTSLQSFGAFIDIGGIEGLLPVSEISWGHTERACDALKSGQEVELIIKRLDWENGRLSFSLKDALPDPWDEAESRWPAGSFHFGKVARLAQFGAFVTLADGVDGLLHVSRLGGERRIAHPEEVLKKGQKIEVKVDSVDRYSRKMSLSLADVSRRAEEDEAYLKDYQASGNESGSVMKLGDLIEEGGN